MSTIGSRFRFTREKRTIIDALAKSGGNVTHTAKELGISRATLQTKMKAYGLRATKG